MWGFTITTETKVQGKICWNGHTCDSSGPLGRSLFGLLQCHLVLILRPLQIQWHCLTSGVLWKKSLFFILIIFFNHFTIETSNSSAIINSDFSIQKSVFHIWKHVLRYHFIYISLRYVWETLDMLFWFFRKDSIMRHRFRLGFCHKIIVFHSCGIKLDQMGYKNANQ